MTEQMNLEALLRRDGVLVYKTRGVSMRPLFKENRDLVTIRPCQRGGLKKYDVPLYRRRDGRFTLHRIIGVQNDTYVIRGDNTFAKEYVPESQIVGVLTEFQRKGKKHTVDESGYRAYARFWNAVYPVRLVLHKVRRLGGKIKRAIKGEQKP